MFLLVCQFRFSESMRKTFLPLLLVPCLIFSCHEKEMTANQEKKCDAPWPEAKIRQYFEDSIAYSIGDWMSKDSMNSFDVFASVMLCASRKRSGYNSLIYALDEPYLDTGKIDPSLNRIRITVSPCFRNPYGLIMEKKGNETILTVKVSDGDGAYYCGMLDTTFQRTFPEDVYDEFSTLLHQADFWALGIDTTCTGGLDGERWYFEAIEKGKYNSISRWAPEHCGNTTTLQLGKIGNAIRKLASSNLLNTHSRKTDSSRVIIRMRKVRFIPPEETSQQS